MCSPGSHPGSQERFGRHVVTPNVIKGRTPVLPPTLIWQSHLVIPGVLEAGYSHFAPQPSLHPCRVRPRSCRLSFNIGRTPTRARSDACAHTSVGPLSLSSLYPLSLPFSLCTYTAEFAPPPAPLSRRLPCRYSRGMLSPPRRRSIAGYSHMRWHPHEDHRL